MSPGASGRRISIIVLISLTVISLASPVLKHFIYGWLALQGRFAPYSLRFVHDWGHLLAFTAAAAIMLSISQTRNQIACTLSALLATAVLTEMLQHWLYRNPLEWQDIRNDFCGIAIAWLCLLVLRRRQKQSRAAFAPR